MNRHLFTLLCYLLTATCFSEDLQEELIPSTPDQLAALRSGSSELIGGFINPMSGQPSLRQTDLVVKGSQNISLTRIYIPPFIPSSFPKYKHSQEEHDKKHLYEHLVKHYKGWQFLPHLKLQYHLQFGEVRLSEPSGATLGFHLSSSRAILSSPPYAMSNTVGDEPSGKYDPRNIRISYEEGGSKIVVYAADGAIRFYQKKGAIKRTSYLFLLQKEILPNGKVLRYHYNESSQLSHIESLDPQERYVYASLQISDSPAEGSCHFTASSGLTADYTYQKRPLHVKIKDGHRKESFNVTCPPLLTSVSSPVYRHEALDYCDRHLLGFYSGKDHLFSLEHKGFGNVPHYRVHKISHPVGINDSLQTVYEINYRPPIAGTTPGLTHVKNADGTFTIYHFSKNLLTTAIQYFGTDGGLKKEKILSWDNYNWLQSIEMRDGQKNLLYKKSYEYDTFGNPTLEIFTGDLTGTGLQESDTIRKEFSQDGRNLLVKEEHENGKIICFSYLPQTDLVTAKLTKDHDYILLREFSDYDDSHNLVQTISDDGTEVDKDDLSGVTQRTLTKYTLRQQAPFLHMPEWIEEKCQDQQHEKLLKRKHLLYDNYGNIAQEKVYDANGDLAYTIYKEYNERGDLLSETNSLGQKAIYGYTHRGLQNFKTNFSGRVHTTTHYDTNCRLREKRELGNEGIAHTTLFNYDFHDRLIQEVDPFDNATHYSYNPLVNKIDKTNFPAVASIDGQPVFVGTSSSYDPFGRETTQTDANENTTHYRYNAYGSPVEITYPDGGKAFFLYQKNGTLASHTDQDGLTVHYTRDILGRVLSGTYVSSQEEILAQETFTYNGFNLLTETDKEWNLTRYVYDGAGRKIREDLAGHITDFTYDALGRLATICKHNGDNTLFIHYKRDLEGRLLEESKTDASGDILYKTSYAYDEDGNKSSITRYINGDESVDTFTYDSYRRLIEQRDPSSFITKRSYNEYYINPLGQRVLQTTITNPLNIATVETKDSLNRSVKKEVLTSQGTVLSCGEMIHDPHGNLIYQKDHVYENGRFIQTQTLAYTYTPTHKMESFTKAYGEKSASTTTYSYFPSGKVKTKILPNGIGLFYDYHPLGALSHLSSSDGKIVHSFEYDNLGHLTRALDETQKIAIERTVDPFGNVTQEVFPQALVVDKKYDHLNRLNSLQIEGVGEISYKYDPLYLREVTRFSQSGKALYTHRYENYDLDGNLLSEKLLGDLGEVLHNTDLRGQETAISSPYFSQNCSYDSTGNLIENVVDQVEHFYTYDGLSQLSSEKNSSRSFIYEYNSLYNRTKKNDTASEINDLNQLLSLGDKRCVYDLNGNQINKQTPSEEFYLTYDPLNRLVEAVSQNKMIAFSYDPLGRRLSKIVSATSLSGYKETEHYLYHDQHEIGAFDDTLSPKNLRVLGIGQNNSPSTISIELEGQVFAPLLDVQDNVCGLVDPDSQSIAAKHEWTAFGEELQTTGATLYNPWRFASKRFDPDLGLIYFGKRDYDPEFARWLTTDPAGCIDSANLYQYVFNNPFLYRDPDGQFAFAIPLLMWGAELFVPALSACVAPIVYTAITGAIAYGGYKVIEAIAKNTEVYAPDRPLPLTEDGVPIPEVDVPHTEIGTRESTRRPGQTYPQAREFDKNGQHVRDIDFTDHGQPTVHPNPHQHVREPNPTGGTPRRGDPEPLPGWRYQ